MGEKMFLTLSEAADFLSFTKPYLYKLVFNKKIPYYKPAHQKKGHLLFDRAELEALVRAGRVSSAAELSAKADSVPSEGGA